MSDGDNYETSQEVHVTATKTYVASRKDYSMIGRGLHYTDRQLVNSEQLTVWLRRNAALPRLERLKNPCLRVLVTTPSCMSFLLRAHHIFTTTPLYVINAMTATPVQHIVGCFFILWTLILQPHTNCESTL